MQRPLLPLLAAAVLCLPAAAGASGYRFPLNIETTAEPLAAGQIELGFNGVVAYQGGADPDNRKIRASRFALFPPEGWIRYGATESFDLSLKVFPDGLAVRGKQRLFTAGSVTVALAPAAAFGVVLGDFNVRELRGGDEGTPMGEGAVTRDQAFVTLDMALLGSLPLWGGVTGYAAPRFLVIKGVGSVDEVVLGSGLALGMEFGKEGFVVVPEVAVHVTFEDTYDPLQTGQALDTLDVNLGTGLKVAF